MSGIYIHIPYCKKACHYCNFHFSTNLSTIDAMIDALCKDIDLRHHYLVQRKINTVYFGGGTPSLLHAHHLDKIFTTLTKYFDLSHVVECTFECNPDDIDRASLELFRSFGINRLSIGVQSFFEDDLRLMNRAHTSDEARSCIQLAQDFGYDNITIDLIYGFTTDEKWQKNIERALAFDLPHLSAYCLTIERKTVFDQWIKTNKMSEPDDELAVSQFDYLMDTLVAQGYEHYEISNFGKPQKHAIHNTNYWQGIHYLGLGPSAHSYNGHSRSWTIADNQKYIHALNDNSTYVEVEELSDRDIYNEYILTRLRTMWGIDRAYVKEHFEPSFADHLTTNIYHNSMHTNLLIDDDSIRLTRAGKHFADQIASRLFYE